jgi:lipid A 3-O-deacylase
MEPLLKSDSKHFQRHAAVEKVLHPLHDPGKYAYSILLCLLLFIPLSVFAADTAAFSDGDLSDKLQNTAFHTQPDIWRSGVGEGFRAGIQVVGLTAGAAYGLLIFGSEERHHLALISVSYVQIIGGVKGSDKWYQGNWELRAELFGGAQFNSETCALIGLTPHLRYNFATGTRFVPYIDSGAGVSLTAIRAPDLGGAFQFNLQALTGVNYFVKDDLSINIAMQYFHLSSSAISMPNNGVNTVGYFLGAQWFF